MSWVYKRDLYPDDLNATDYKGPLPLSLCATVEEWEKSRNLGADAKRLVLEVERLRDEISRLRQAHWDGRAAWGFDNGGDPTPEAVCSDFSSLIRDDWKEVVAYTRELEKGAEHGE